MNDAVASLSSTTRVRLDPSVVPVVLSPDHVQLRAGPWAGPILTLRDEEYSGTLGPAIDQFDGGASIADVTAAIDDVDEETVRQLLAAIDEKNLLQRAGAAGTKEPSSQPLRFGRDDLATLASKSVLVVSSGEIGPRVVEMLTDAGVGEVSVCHRHDDGTAGAFESAMAVSTWDDEAQSLPDLLERVDLAVTATDRPWAAATRRVNELALEAGTPLARGTVTGYDIVVGPTVLPGETACYECYRHHRNTTIPSPETYEEFERAAAGRTIDTRLPFSAIAAGFLVTDVVNVLCYGHGFTVGSVVTYDMAGLSMEANDVLHRPRCEACSDLTAGIGQDALFTIEDLAGK